MRKFLIFIPLLISLACGNTAPRKLSLYPSATVEFVPTQTERVVIWTQTAAASPTPKVIVVSETPVVAGEFCVSALVAVYLRPSPNLKNYPITEIPNGTRLKDLGGRDGNWAFVEFGDKRGWVHEDYLAGESCLNG